MIQDWNLLTQINQTESHPTPQEHTPFGANLEPFLIQALHGKLSKIQWFRTDWQRGGAATGYAQFTDNQQKIHQVVVKLPVPPIELLWLNRLQNHPNIAPKVFSSGQTVGPYDIAYVIMQRLPHGPINQAWQENQYPLLYTAAAKFYAAAIQYPLANPKPQTNWQHALESARKNVKDETLPNPQQWKNALKNAKRHLKDWLEIYNQRPLTDTCHGDLHFGNALSPNPAPQGPAILIDFAQTYTGSWIEDAVNLEYLNWSNPELIKKLNIPKNIAKARRAENLPVSEDWAQHAQILRLLYAMTTPASLANFGQTKHLNHALNILESV